MIPFPMRLLDQDDIWTLPTQFAELLARGMTSSGLTRSLSDQHVRHDALLELQSTVELQNTYHRPVGVDQDRDGHPKLGCRVEASMLAKESA
jgi:hypothetical protein